MSAPELSFDKNDWTPVKFGDVAFEPKESEKDARTAGIEHVVGLEHIDSEDIHLRRSNGIDESTTFTKKFSKGDILFGRRRAYLKKAAQATFTGICSGDITVLRAKENLLPELLPFIVNNDKFFDWAITHSAGGLSPRCKFKDLANYEFLLPPKEQQAEIAELLWAMDDVVENKRTLVERTIVCKSSLFKEDLSKVECRTAVIGEIADPNKNSCIGGPFGSDLSGKHYVESPGVPVIRGTNLTIGGAEFVDEGFVFVSEDKAETLIRNMAYPGDIVVTQRGTLGQVGLIPLNSKYERYVVSQSQMKLKVDVEKALPKFIFYYLCSLDAQHAINVATISTGIPHINLGIFKSLKIMLPSIKQQEWIVSRLKAMDTNYELQIKAMVTSKSLQKSLINQVF